MDDLTVSELNLLAARASGSTVVTATGVAVGRQGWTATGQKKIEDAMLAALMAAQQAGITDPDEIKRRMLAAQQAALGD